MITNTEDKFDVDYDIFSFAGRATLIGGGLYALDKSIKDGVFKSGPKDMGKLNNKYVSDMAEVLKQDNVSASKKVDDIAKIKPRSFFKASPKRPLPITLAGVHDEEVISLRDLLDGGYKNRSAGLIEGLEALRNEVRVLDADDEFLELRKRKSNVVSGRMTVQRDVNGKVLSVGIDSLAGKHIINVVDKDGRITIGDNQYLTRSQFSPDGLKPGKEYGVDVAQVRFLKENHAKMLRGELSHQEVRSRLNKTLTYDGKVYHGKSGNRIDANVRKNILNSAQDNVFSPMNHIARAAVMKEAAINGHGVASATNLNDGIIRLYGDAIGDIDGLAYTSNPNQLFRANTFYIDPEGNKKAITDVNMAFLDKKQMERFQKIAKEKYGFNFGDLAKEELIANSKLLGSVGDNSRSLQIRGDHLTDASEFILEEMQKITGLSRDEFETKIRDSGFDAFDSEVRKKLQTIGTLDYTNHIKKELKASSQKRRALLHANNTDFDALNKERERLADLKNVLSGRLKGKPRVGEALKKEAPEFANRLNLLYEKYSDYSKNSLQVELDTVNKKLKDLNKKFKHGLMKTSEFEEAMKLKQQGLLERTIINTESHHTSLIEKMRDSFTFGLSKDKMQIQRISKEYRGLTIDNMHIGQDGEITFSLLKTSKIGQGIKGIDEAGEAKAVFKSASDFIGEILIDMHLEDNKTITDEERKAYENVHLLANKNAMKDEITDRNLADTIISIRQKNAANKNPEVTKLLNEFDSSKKGNSDYEKLIRDLDKLGNGDIQQFVGTEYSSAFIKAKSIAFGSAAEDLGAGKLGFIAERHIALMIGSGLQNFASSVIRRKTTLGATKNFIEFSKVQDIMKSSVNAGYINFDQLEGAKPDSSFYKFMSEVFPSVTEEGMSNLDNLKSREATLRKLGKYENGAAFVSLNGNFNGYNKIPIFANESIMGLIGEQIGFDGDYKRYTEIDRLTKDILYEAYSPNRSEKKLKTLLTNYDEAMKQMGSTLKDKILSGKVKNSMVGQASSGSKALNDYSDAIFNKGIKHAAPSVAAVSKKQFIDMFGQEHYDHFIKHGKSKSWAFAIREPVEGLSGLPVNVVPASSFDGISDLTDGRVALVANRSNSILNMVFGDYDGDQLSLIAATDDASTEEISRLATSNEADAVAFRLNQEIKTKFQLKGAHSKSILSNDLAALTLSNYYAKDLEKGFVGIASKSLEGLHAVNSRINTGEDYYRTKTILHTVAENIIKGKSQSIDDLRQKKSQQILNAIIGNEEFGKASITERISKFREFIDDVMLGDASHFGDRLRKGEKGADFVKEIATALGGKTQEEIEKSMARADDLVHGGWFASTTNDDAMEKLMKVSGLSKRGVDDVADSVENIISQELGASQHRLAQLGEKTAETLADQKRMFKGTMGNAMKYAILPAAAFGILGTVFGARSNITPEVEFSDSGRTHERSSNSPIQLALSPNMKRPTHMKPEVKGQAQTGFQINKYASSHKVGSMRLQDDTRNFDYFDMQDKMERGY